MPVGRAIGDQPMSNQRPLPEFATAQWYADPRDHRCPHDGWLESVEITEPASGARQERRATAVTLRLLGAYHDGHIRFRYTGVTSYRLSSEACGRGVGDWLRDELTVVEGGLLRHQITWCNGPDGESEWVIEAENVAYEWVPRND